MHKQSDPNAAEYPEGDPLDGLMAVSIRRLAVMAGLSRSFLYLEIRSGRLPIRKKGRRTVILLDDARAWLRGKVGGP